MVFLIFPQPFEVDTERGKSDGLCVMAARDLKVRDDGRRPGRGGGGTYLHLWISDAFFFVCASVCYSLPGFIGLLGRLRLAVTSPATAWQVLVAPAIVVLSP